MIDVATRVVPAAVLRPTTKVGRRERAAGPRPDPRAGAAGLARGAEDGALGRCPTSGCSTIDARLEHAAARPVIVPDTIVIDHGSVFVSAAFRSACRHLGISIQPAHLGSGAEKGHIERHFGIGRLAVLPSSPPAMPGAARTAAAATSRTSRCGRMAELQELLDEWLIALAEPAPRRAPRPRAPGPGVHPEREVRRPGRGRRLRPGRARPGRLRRAAARRAGGRSTPTASS